MAVPNEFVTGTPADADEVNENFTDLDTRLAAEATARAAADTAEATARTQAITTHEADTTGVHGIADTSALATDTEVSVAVAAEAVARAEADALKVDLADVGEAGGVAALDAEGRVVDASGVPVESTGGGALSALTDVDATSIANLRQQIYDAAAAKWKSYDARPVNVKWFGAKGDGRVSTGAAITSGTKILTDTGRTVTDAAMTAASAVLSSATGAFSSDDVGRRVLVAGAAASGGNLLATIASYTNSTTVTLDTAASTTVSGATANLAILGFTSADVGKRAHVVGAGTSGGILAAQVSSVQSATQATLSVNASTTITSGELCVATDDYTALQAAFDYVALNGVGGTVFFPAGIYGTMTRVNCYGGCKALGSSVDYSNVENAPRRGSVIRYIGSTVASAVMQFGTDSTGTTPGTGGASAEWMIFDAAGYSNAATTTIGRRTYLRSCQMYRGKVNAHVASGQNGYVLDCIIGNVNVGTSLLVTAIDTKIIGCQIRQGSVAQCELRAVDDVLFAHNHIFGGFQGVLTGTTGDNILITGTCNMISIVDNILDGTMGHHINVAPGTGTKSVSRLIVNGNQFWQQGVPTNTYTAVNLDATAASSAIRYVTVTNNTFNGNDQSWKGVTTISAGTVVAVVVDHNNGFGLTRLYDGIRPDALGGNNVRRTSGGLMRRSGNAATATLTGDGTATAFTITHELDVPSAAQTAYSVFLGAVSIAGTFVAQASQPYVSGKNPGSAGTGFTVTFPSAPANGATVTVDWQGRL